MKNKLFEVFVCMLLIGTCFVVTTVSAEQDGDYTYTVSNGEATITGYTGAGGAITIPSTLGGYPTVHIGDSAFFDINNMDRSNLITSVIIPNSVTNIGYRSFFHCENMTSVTIGNNVTFIDWQAFQWCSSLTSVVIPDSVTIIDSEAFSCCKSLISIVIPGSVTEIKSSAFEVCSSLNSVTLPKNITTIEINTFADCRSLTSVTIPNSVTTIEYKAFLRCYSLASVTIGSSVTTIEDGAFAYCSNLTSITFLGLVAPKILENTTPYGSWIGGTHADLRGHAYTNSNFPPPGEHFHGLIMGTELSGTGGNQNKPPVAGFIWTPSTPTINQQVTFDASSSNDHDGSIKKYEWDWNNDGTYDDDRGTPTTTHSWAQTGNYPITLRVTDNGSSTSTKTLFVTIVSGDGGGTGDTNGDGNTSGNGATDNKGTPGFELVFVIGAIAVALLIWRKKRNV